ncbi:MAG: response regulator [Pyrinomonadaceae bacterium]|nr:response regulator [Pyrinomonadaceae bacterium]
MKRSIFYFDDEAGCLTVFQEMFDGEYDVRTATTLSEARRVLAERPADIVITDQLMPEISGTEFLCEVAGAHPSSYRMMLTGSMLVGEALPEIGSGIVQFFVTKPWKESNMREVLERAKLRLDLRDAE